MQEVKTIIEGLRELFEKSLAEGDFTHEHNLELQKYSDALKEIQNLDAWAHSVFELIEEYDSKVDLTLGSPGPLVHVLESSNPEHHEYLAESLIRKPTGTTVWMADRISRSPNEDKELWVKRIKDVLGHPDASISAREMAEEI